MVQFYSGTNWDELFKEKIINQCRPYLLNNTETVKKFNSKKI